MAHFRHLWASPTIHLVPAKLLFLRLCKKHEQELSDSVTKQSKPITPLKPNYLIAIAVTSACFETFLFSLALIYVTSRYKYG